MQASLAPVRLAGYRRLLASYVLNTLGDSAALIALPVLIYDRSHSATATAGFFVAGRFVPALLAPLVTARVDRLRVDRVMPAIYLTQAVIFAGLALLVHHYSYAAVLALALVDGTLALTGRGLARGAVA